MSEICVLCGKGYTKKVTVLHIKSHRHSQKRYEATAEALPAEAWDYYWANDSVRSVFPDPIGSRSKPWKGFTTYEQWGQNRHPEWWG